MGRPGTAKGRKMQNLPDVHANDRDIPAGKVMLAEYGRQDGPMPVRTVLDRKLGWGKREVTLEAVTAGWACAGSVMRWDNGHFAVSWHVDGSTHGSRYRNIEDAQKHFERIPTKPL